VIPRNAIRDLALHVAVKEFINKLKTMISTNTNKMEPGVWFKIRTDILIQNLFLYF